MAHTAHAVDSSGPSQPAPPVSTHPEIAPLRSPSLVHRIVGPYRTVARFLERRALVRAARAVPRTLRFMTTTVMKDAAADDVRGHRNSLGMAIGVAADEAFLALAMAPSRFPRRADYARVSAELADAHQMFSSRGWITRPSSYHRAPPPLASEDVHTSRGWAMGVGYERMAYESGFSPRTGEPGTGRWMGYGPNRDAVAAIVRRPDDARGPRPWLVCVHGFAMGYPFMDFTGLHTARLHRALGVNVALPVLPLHGPRKVTRVSGEPFLSFDLMNTVHGFSQAIWDIRRLLSWIRAPGSHDDRSVRHFARCLCRGASRRHRGRVRRGRRRHPGRGPPGPVPGAEPCTHPSPVDRAQHHRWCRRRSLLDGVAPELRSEGAHGSPLHLRGPRRPPRISSRTRVGCGSTGSAHRSAGTGGPTWATSGPGRLPPSSRTRCRRPDLDGCHRTRTPG